MKKWIVPSLMFIFLISLVINYLSLPTLATSASCKSGVCMCSCENGSDKGCSCDAGGGRCKCVCTEGGRSSCGFENEG